LNNGKSSSGFPHNWSLLKAGDVIEIKTGGTPSKKKSDYWDGTIKWMSSGEVSLKRIRDVEGRITEEGLQNSNARYLPKGTVMIALNGQGKTRGTVAILEAELTCNQSLAGFLPSKQHNSYYLLYNLENRYNEIRNLTGDNARTGLNLGILKDLEILLPPIPEQNKIASILLSIDETIEKTEAIIEQTEKMKKGLMQQLLTKGIGHTKFKKTEIGEIPDEWKVKPLEDLCERIFVGIATSTTKSYTKNGIPIIRNQNIHENHLDTSDLLQITNEFSEKNKNKKLLSGDVLTVRTGYPGITCVVPEELEGSHTFTTLVSRPIFDYINPYYLSRYINSAAGKKFVTGGKAGGAQQNLNVAIMKKMLIALPSVEEQNNIVNILTPFEEKVSNERKKYYALQNIKKGLMQVLLTGKVRVKVDDPEVISS
jgi:type I restriction enzyme, S subunit